MLANLDALFDLLKRFDLAAAHAGGYIHGNDDYPSGAFADCNTGVIAYRNTQATQRFLARWRDTFPLFIKSTVADQNAFRRAMWDSDASLCILPPEYSCRLTSHIRLVDDVKILHGRTSDYAALAARLNKKNGPRLFALSEDHRLFEIET